MGPLRWRRASSYFHPRHRPGRGLLTGKASTGKVGDPQVAWVEMWVHTRFSFPCSPRRTQCHQRPAQSMNSGWEGRRRARLKGREVQLSPVPPPLPRLTSSLPTLPCPGCWAHLLAGGFSGQHLAVLCGEQREPVESRGGGGKGQRTGPGPPVSCPRTRTNQAPRPASLLSCFENLELIFCALWRPSQRLQGEEMISVPSC